MSESNGHAVVIDQSDDFVGFDFEGLKVEVDLFAAYEEMARIDILHKDDPWVCYACMATGLAVDPTDEVKRCPACQCADPEKFRRSEAFLDDVAAYVRRLGAPRCSRNAAAAVYKRLVDAMEEVKKKQPLMPESHTGSESTPPVLGA